MVLNVMLIKSTIYVRNLNHLNFSKKLLFFKNVKYIKNKYYELFSNCKIKEN